MPKYSKSHERDEGRLMNKGFYRSLFALLLCWLPGIGLLLAISGFLRMAVRVTHTHRAKRIFMTIFSVVVLLVCVGVLIDETYQYVTNPKIIDEGIHWVWKEMTGADTLPWQAEPSTAPASDIYAGDGDDPYYNGETAASPDSAPSGYDYDSDFDDSALDSFEEDASTDQEAKDLLDQMILDKRTPTSVLPVG